MNINYVGNGNVQLIAGGGRIFTDVAARFVNTEKPLMDIISAPYDAKLVQKIVNSGHKAAVEFDYFLFGVEGYSRVTEVQLVRKRLASYLIKSGRKNKSGKRSFDVVIPEAIEDLHTQFAIYSAHLKLADGTPLNQLTGDCNIYWTVSTDDILELIELWYAMGVEKGYAEEDLRYLKPQATEFKAIIGMNAHALLDWFQIRCCKKAQTEMRDLANKMLKLCKDVAPDIFINAGPSCKVLGYCPENGEKHKECKGVITRDKALIVLHNYNRLMKHREDINE